MILFDVMLLLPLGLIVIAMSACLLTGQGEAAFLLGVLGMALMFGASVVMIIGDELRK